MPSFVSRRDFLIRTPAVAALPFFPRLLFARETPAPLFAYVGTFSSPLHDVLPTQVDLPPGNGRGIHIFRVDTNRGKLNPVDVFESGTSPSCLVVNANGTGLYSANETDRVGDKKEGTVSAFAIEPSTGQLTLLNTVRSGGAGPTYISLHTSGRFLLVANYFGGSIAVIPIAPDGKLEEPAEIKVDSGAICPRKSADAPPGSFAFSGHDRTHAHMVLPDHSGRFILHIDLGLDRIYVWKFNQSTGALTPNDPAYVTLPPGSGPRHCFFHPNGRWLYSLQEEASTIALFDYNPDSGQLSQRQTLSSLPPGFAGSNFGSEILVSADGRSLYAGNRLHDSIGIFRIARDGTLTFVAEEWTRGNYPRSFNFDPSGRFLYCCNQRDDNVTIFKVDRRTGRLKFTDQYVPVGNPSCVAFATTSQAQRDP